MHIGFFACLHAISLERSRFNESLHYFSYPLYSTEAVDIAHKPPPVIKPKMRRIVLACFKRSGGGVYDCNLPGPMFHLSHNNFFYESVYKL